MDLRKTYVRVNKEARGKICRTVDQEEKSKLALSVYLNKVFYIHARLTSNVSSYFGFKSKLRHGCWIHPWFFKVYMDRVIRVVYSLTMSEDVCAESENQDISQTDTSPTRHSTYRQFADRHFADGHIANKPDTSLTRHFTDRYFADRQVVYRQFAEFLLKN